MIVVALAGGGAATWLAWPEPPPPAPAQIPAPALRVAGQLVESPDDVIGEALDLVRRYAVGAVKLRLPGGRVVEISRVDLGLEIDRMRLGEFVKEALRPGSPLARAHAERRAGEPLDVPLPLRIDGERALGELVDLKAEVDSFAVDATIDLDKRVVRPEQVGYRLDVYGTLARLEAAFRAGGTEVDAVVDEIKPKRTAAELEGVRFDAVLGWFETRYNPSRRYEDRSYNLRLAASKLDGTVLMPGEVFDFNGVVGPRDEAHGYRVATVIAQGELVDGIGGGTCQISGTLHAAAMFAGLDIVERYPHSRPSSYIKLGLDATVSYPNINYRFKNPYDFPVVLHEKVAGGVVRAEILGPERKRTVSYFRRIDDILPFEEVERESPKLPVGERVVIQRGIPGFVATASRVVREGAHAERTKWREKYPPTTQIVAVGTAPEDTKPALKPDTHAEYTVDEYLVITQGLGVRSPQGDMLETREPGKTGNAGWMKELGLEKTPPAKSEEEGASEDKPGREGHADEKRPAKKKPGDKTEPKKTDKKSDAKKPDKKTEAKKKP